MVCPNSTRLTVNSSVKAKPGRKVGRNTSRNTGGNDQLRERKHPAKPTTG
jgi:hypothetical protein